MLSGLRRCVSLATPSPGSPSPVLQFSTSVSIMDAQQSRGPATAAGQGGEIAQGRYVEPGKAFDRDMRYLATRVTADGRDGYTPSRPGATA